MHTSPARRPDLAPIDDVTFARQREADAIRVAETRARINEISDRVRAVIARRDAAARAQPLPA